MVVVATKKSQRCVKMFLPSLATSCKVTSIDKHWIRIVSTGERKSLWRLFGWSFGVGKTKPAPKKEDAQQVLPLLQTDVVRLLACPAHPATYKFEGEFKTRSDDRSVDFSYDRQRQLLLIRLRFCDVDGGNNAVSPFVQFCSLDDNQPLVSVGDCLVNRNQSIVVRVQKIDGVLVIVEKINHSNFGLVSTMSLCDANELALASLE